MENRWGESLSSAARTPCADPGLRPCGYSERETAAGGPPPSVRRRKEEGAQGAPSRPIFLRARTWAWLPLLLVQITRHKPVSRYLRLQNATGDRLAWVTSVILEEGRTDIGGQQESSPPCCPLSSSCLTEQHNDAHFCGGNTTKRYPAQQDSKNIKVSCW